MPSLTHHQLILGGLLWYCEEANFFGPEVAKPSIKRQKTVVVQQDIFELLRVFALTAWLELTEKWYAMPVPMAGSTQSLAKVSNMFPLEVRCLARHVREEEHLSSLPLVEHVCCMCGRGLAPSLPHIEGYRERGKPGMAMHVRCSDVSDQDAKKKSEVPWDAMPLFLMLWSKKTLGRILPSVFM